MGEFIKMLYHNKKVDAYIPLPCCKGGCRHRRAKSIRVADGLVARGSAARRQFPLAAC